MDTTLREPQDSPSYPPRPSPSVTPAKRRISQEPEADMVVVHTGTPASSGYPPHTLEHVRQASPALSDASSILSSLPSTATPANPGHTPQGPSGVNPPAKRKKLTPTEKAEQERLKAEKRVQREEQKRVKDEERRQKNEVAEEKKRERDLKKQEKDLKKQQEDEEKLKKERAQSRMTAFFAKPKTSNQTTPVKPKPASPADDASPLKPLDESDYRKTFLPYELPSNATKAPINRFSWDAQATALAKAQADSWFTGATYKQEALDSILDLSPLEKAPRGYEPTPITQILAAMGSSQSQPIDVDVPDPHDALKACPMKYLFYHKDVRPPYIGTLTKVEPAREKRAIARNPFCRGKPSLDYDDDSEAEWEEPEEGEDLDSDSDDEAEGQFDEDDLEFLDDEGQDDMAKNKKKVISGDMQPLSTGLCWENEAQQLCLGDAVLPHNPQDFAMESLLDLDFPLDPFSTEYWNDPDTPMPAPAAVSASAGRQPLQARPNIAINGTSQSKPTAEAKPVRILSGPELGVFKEVVNGSASTKAVLLDQLKQRLPKVPKQVLNHTLSNVAASVGSKKADKRWVLLQT